MCVKFSGRWSLGGLLLLLCVSGVTQAAVALQRWQTAQGATVMFVESHANPMVDVQVDFDAGTRRDTLAKPGVSELTADLLDAGTRRHDEEQLRGQLADLGAQFSTYAQDESAGLRLRSLTEPALLQPALAVAAEMLSTPTFPTAVLQREKQRSIEMLKQQETKAEFLAERTLSRLVYPTHPYGNDARLSETSLQSISRADLVTFWRQHYQPQRAVVSIVGDVSREQAQRLAEQLLAGLFKPMVVRHKPYRPCRWRKPKKNYTCVMPVVRPTSLSAWRCSSVMIRIISRWWSATTFWVVAGLIRA
nr:pitrilysin family protein [Paludibacterium denitrificans]